MSKPVDKPSDSKTQRVSHAEALGSMWLARFNELNEAGKGRTKKAEYCLERSQYWLDKANEWSGLD